MKEIHLARWRNFLSQVSKRAQPEEEETEQVYEGNEQLTVDIGLIIKTDIVGKFRGCKRGKSPGMDDITC